jgi:hypothetical protein
MNGRIMPQKHSKDRKMEGRKMLASFCGACCSTESIALMIPQRGQAATKKY